MKIFHENLLPSHHSNLSFQLLKLWVARISKIEGLDCTKFVSWRQFVNSNRSRRQMAWQVKLFSQRAINGAINPGKHLLVNAGRLSLAESWVPWFESQAQHLSSIYIAQFIQLNLCICNLDWGVKGTNIIRKEAGIGPFKNNIYQARSVVVSQLVGRLFPTSEVHSSIPVIGKI